ncbi:MAG: LPP20 family lipoprotein [Nitrospira sp.]|nr:LPP20 family lipoprotein [Nitrospira sp.]MDH4251076.1 LPP20 family lipoprotein [Nitrospira sp.]MDH4344557.1 LPP20 family lipoprotein [Nitrospira sp.]MDH5337895.1 LPP20 family lipoprotein [Nitrospira sp.]
MMRAGGSAFGQGIAVFLCLGLMVSAPTGCTWFTGKGKPGWVDGRSVDYPSSQYLTGVGQADTRSNAEDQAYAAVARIFKAEVAAQAKDWESYWVVENHGVSNAERRLTIDNVTKVSTDKVLENVRIADVWYDSKSRVYYALSVMNRPQAEASLMEKVAALDRTVDTDVTESRQAIDKLAKVRALRRAGRNLVLREVYNTDLRVIRPSGQGTPSAYQVNELSSELEQFLAANLVLEVQVSGDHAEPVGRALAEGLIREGLRVTTKMEGEEGGAPELIVRGTVRLFPIEVRDPHFKYVRWCSDFEVVEPGTRRVVGATAHGGREGHLTEREATAKTLRVMQQELSSDVAKAIAAHIFGEIVLPETATMPASCPREESGVRR